MRSLVQRTFAVISLVVLATTAACGSGNPPSGGATSCGGVSNANLSIGGGATGGLYFTLGATLSTLLREESCGSGTTLAGSANEFFRNGSDVIFTQTDQAYAAYSGEGGQGFQAGEKYPYLLLAVGWSNSSLLVTKKDSPINNVRDLKPTDVVATTSQASADALAEVFRLHGVSPKVSVITDFDQMFTALRQGQVSVAQRAVAHPESTILEVDRNLGLKPVYHDATVMDGMLKKYPDYTVVNIPANTYSFMTKDYPTFARQTVVVVDQRMDNALAEQLARLFYERTDKFVASVPFAKDFTLDTLKHVSTGLRVPFHPGAAAYLQKQGVAVRSS